MRINQKHLVREAVRCAVRVCAFWRRCAATRRRAVILLWDGLPARRSAAVRQALRRHRDWLRVERLPADAPEFNPLEPLWDWLDDHALANTPAENLPCLGQRVRRALHAKANCLDKMEA